MLSDVMNALSNLYTGDTIYVPDSLWPLIEKWLRSRRATTSMRVFGRMGKHELKGVGDDENLRWQGKKVVSIDEVKLSNVFRDATLPLPISMTGAKRVIIFDLPEDSRGEVENLASRRTGDSKFRKGVKLW